MSSSAGLPPRPQPDDGPLRAAFRDLHAGRLHAFALLVTLGDRDVAARISTDAIDDGARRAAALRHPERAAAWLRARLVRAASRARRRRGPTVDERRAALGRLGVDPVTFDALAALSVEERAILVAADNEELAAVDLETILDRGSRAVRATLARARRRYLAAFSPAASGTNSVEPAFGDGPIAERVRRVAQLTFRSGPAR